MYQTAQAFVKVNLDRDYEDLLAPYNNSKSKQTAQLAFTPPSKQVSYEPQELKAEA